jgi:hypothetical protein
MAPARALVVVVLLRALIAVPTVQLVLIALMIKYGFAATLAAFLEPDKGRLRSGLVANLLGLAVEYFKGLNWLKVPTESIAAEVSESERPFTQAFGGSLTIYRSDDRFIADPYSPFAFLRDIVRESSRVFARFEGVPRAHTDYVPRFQAASVVEQLRATAPDLDPDLDPEPALPPSVAPDGYRQLPATFKSILLYHSLPPLPRELTPAMHRRLLRYPVWVSQYVRHAPSLMLLPEHYLILRPVLAELSALPDDDTADVSLLEYLQPELIGVLVRLLFGAHRRSALALLAEVGHSFAALDAILDRVADELPSCAPERLRSVLDLLEALKAQPDFGPLFGDRFAPALVAAAPLDPLGPRADLELLARAASLCADAGAFPPRAIHALAFLLVVDGGRAQAVAAFAGGLPRGVAERVAPYVRRAVDAIVADFDVRASAHHSSSGSTRSSATAARSSCRCSTDFLRSLQARTCTSSAHCARGSPRRRHRGGRARRPLTQGSGRAFPCQSTSERRSQRFGL